MPEYLTTRELAEMLRIKERKVYDLAAAGDIPCSKAMGKLLFPKKAVEAWLAGGTSDLQVSAQSATTATPRPAVFLGSNDPLLEWALRESRCGIATFFDGSEDGLVRFANREGIASGLHLHDKKSDGWNVAQVRLQFSHSPVVLMEWAKRSRGLIIQPDHAASVKTLSDIKGLRVVPRQAEAGAQKLFLHLMAQTGLDPGKLTFTAASRTEQDAALAVAEGKADVAFGLQSLAAQFRLPFVPLVDERFDLLVDRRAWFEPPMQTLLAFCDSNAFKAKAAEMAGLDISSLGKIHFNGS